MIEVVAALLLLAVVGAVIGVGLTKGVRVVQGRRILGIVTGWVLTPACAAIFAILFYRGLLLFNL